MRAVRAMPGAAEPIADLFLGHRNMCYLGAAGSRWCAGESAGLGVDTVTTVPRRIVGEDGWSTLFLGWNISTGIRNERLYQRWASPRSSASIPTG